MNKILAKQFIKCIQKYRKLDNLQVIKIQYSFQVILGELEKLLAMLIIFSTIGKLKEFLLILLSLLLVRHYMGGIHFKTLASCLLMSIVFFSGIIYLGANVSLWEKQRTNIYISNIFFAYFIAPLSSNNRVSASISEKWKTKAKCLASLGVIAVVGHTINRVYEQYILWTLLWIEIEALLVISMLKIQSWKSRM